VKTKISPVAVGMFILGALALFVVLFLSFGGTNFFSKPSRFIVYFDESVSGLEPGAPIKFYGVRIGRVAAINSVSFDSNTRRALVQTVCELNRNVLTDPAGATIDLTKPEELRGMIDRGLRAKLQFTGITGLLFVELVFVEPEKYPVGRSPGLNSLPVIPAIPSPIAEVQQSIIEIVANIKQVDFAALSKDLRVLLATANQKFSELDMKGLAERMSHAAGAVTAFVESPEAKQVFANLNHTINATHAAIAKLDAQVDPVSKDLKRTLADAQVALQSLNAAADTTRRFVAAQGNVGDELTQSLRQVADAAASLERLTDALQRNPNSLLIGKKKAE